MYIDKLGFDPDTVPTLSFGELLKRIGPGINLNPVLSLVREPLQQLSMLGANYGYQMLWLLQSPFSSWHYLYAFLLPYLHVDRHAHHTCNSSLLWKRCRCFCRDLPFLFLSFFTFGNISGSGAGMNLIFGINWKVGALIMIAILLLMYFSKNTYSKVEKGVLLCIMGMIIAFYATLIASGGPAAGPSLRGSHIGNFLKAVYFTHSLSSVLTPPSLPAFTEPIWEQKRNGRKKTSLTAPCLLTALPMSLQLFSFLEPSLRLVLSSFTRQASKSRHRPDGGHVETGPWHFCQSSYGACPPGGCFFKPSW